MADAEIAVINKLADSERIGFKDGRFKESAC